MKGAVEIDYGVNRLSKPDKETCLVKEDMKP